MKFKVILGFFLLIFLADFTFAGLSVDFKFKDLDGKKYTPDSLQGHPIVVYVGSTL